MVPPSPSEVLGTFEFSSRLSYGRMAEGRSNLPELQTLRREATPSLRIRDARETFGEVAARSSCPTGSKQNQVGRPRSRVARRFASGVVFLRYRPKSLKDH